MLLSFTYHHINSEQFSNSFKIIEEHFKYISGRYKTVFPSEYKASLTRIDLCLVFDDAYYDFYYYVFNLLKKYNIKAVLAVPTSFILDDTDMSSETRIQLAHSDLMKDDNFKHNVPFCTWKELNEMSESGHVKLASHGHRHHRLAKTAEDEIDSELSLSKKIIESKINDECNIFVFPHYSYNKEILTKALNLYKFCFGSGGIINYKIDHRVIYRVSADGMPNGDVLFSRKRLAGYFSGAIKNKLSINSSIER